MPMFKKEDLRTITQTLQMICVDAIDNHEGVVNFKIANFPALLLYFEDMLRTLDAPDITKPLC